MLQAYVDGINAYITQHAADHPIEPRLAGLPIEPWSVEDLVAIVHYVHYTHSTNFKAEVIAQKLIDKLGLERASEIFPLTVNPDWADARTAQTGPGDAAGAPRWAQLGLRWSDLLIAPDELNHRAWDRTTGPSARAARPRAGPSSPTTRTWTAASCPATGT